jgi:hypothetical protein
MEGKTKPRYGSAKRDVKVRPVVEFVSGRKYEQKERGIVPERDDSKGGIEKWTSCSRLKTYF